MYDKFGPSDDLLCSCAGSSHEVQKSEGPAQVISNLTLVDRTGHSLASHIPHVAVVVPGTVACSLGRRAVPGPGQCSYHSGHSGNTNAIFLTLSPYRVSSHNGHNTGGFTIVPATRLQSKELMPSQNSA